VIHHLLISSVGARLDAVDLALVVLDPDVVAAGGDAVDGGRGLQEPDALGEEEVLVEQGADGAEVDDVGAELVVEGDAREDVDLARLPRPSIMSSAVSGTRGRSGRTGCT
jgi:hypothetical protein